MAVNLVYGVHTVSPSSSLPLAVALVLCVRQLCSGKAQSVVATSQTSVHLVSEFGEGDVHLAEAVCRRRIR